MIQLIHRLRSAGAGHTAWAGARALLAFSFLLSPWHLPADMPTAVEQLVYSIVAQNGRDYTPTFAPESAGEIYLIASENNFISLRKTLVFFSPQIGRWQTATGFLDKVVFGTLELRDSGGVVRSLSLQRYTYFRVKGDFELNWKVAKNDDADKEYAHYQALSRSYLRAIAEFQKQEAAFQKQYEELTTRIDGLEAAGKSDPVLTERLQNLRKPQPPAPPPDYVVPPSPIQQAFIVDLPLGEYSARLVRPDGTIFEGSEKKIIFHEKRRSMRVGYDVIPSDNWTRPEESNTPSAVLYVNGETDLYIRMFFQDEYNDLAYQRTLDNGAKGNPDLFRWIRIRQIAHSTLEATTAGNEESTLGESPFIVVQNQGETLGYRILPFDLQGVNGEAQPDLVAFRLPISGKSRLYHLRALDGRGSVLAGSERQVRIVRPSPHFSILFALALSPLLAAAAVLAGKLRKSRRAARQ